jgi:hypothetical protein
VIWVVAAPFKQLPGGDGVEATYNVGQQVVVNLGVVAGLVLVLASGVVAARRVRAGRAAGDGVLR